MAHVLQRQGKFREALEELRKGHALGSKQRNWPYPTDRWVRQAERNAELEDRLPAVLQGERKPSDPEETRALAALCYWKQLYGASARLWRDAFAAQPPLAENLNDQPRYNAACAAGLAACAQGRDDPPLDKEERGRWRAQALSWLKADLADFLKVLESNNPSGRVAVRQALANWKKDPDLGGVRDHAALGKLAEVERKTWQTFWSEVDVLLAKAGGRTSP